MIIVPAAVVDAITTLDLPMASRGKSSERSRIRDGHNIDNTNPFIIQSHLITAKSVFNATAKFIAADAKRLPKTVSFKLYFLQRTPFIT